MIPGRTSEHDGIKREVSIDLQGLTLNGTLVLPKDASGLVLFAHGSGSSRHSPRNRFVAQVLHSRKIGTFLFDLLTQEEEARDRYTGELRFNIPISCKPPDWRDSMGRERFGDERTRNWLFRR